MSGTDLDLFANAGDGLQPEHFGIDQHGRAYVVASVFAKAMGYRDAEKATRLLDEAEKGTQIVGTPGGDQRATVIYEDGIWELIFRSTRPGAMSIKARVKAILRQLRETGVVDTRRREPIGLPTDYESALEHLLGEVRQRKALAARNAELEPAAASWTHLAEANGDFSVADAAKILSRDPAIETGERRLFATLADLSWIYRGRGDGKWRCRQSAVDARRVRSRAQSHLEVSSGERVVDVPQVRVTVKGLHDLHRMLGGSGPLLIEVAS